MDVGREDPAAACFAHWGLAKALLDSGDVAGARTHAETAVAMAPTEADRRWAECVLAHVWCRDGDLERGTKRLDELLRQIRDARFVPAQAVFGTSLGEGHFALGDLDRSRAVFEALLSQAQRYDLRHVEAVTCAWLAEIARRHGAPVANDLRARSLDLFEAMGVREARPDLNGLAAFSA
jgi:ATP/maltotriose-dependent transcriptional regulator MalT